MSNNVVCSKLSFQFKMNSDDTGTYYKIYQINNLLIDANLVCLGSFVFTLLIIVVVKSGV